MKTSILLFLLLVSLQGFTQHLIISVQNAGTQQYAVNTLRKLDFSADTVHLHLTNGQTVKWAKQAIRSMYFDQDPSQAKNRWAANAGIKVFPQPNQGNFKVEWQAFIPERVSFEVTNLQGRIVHAEDHFAEGFGTQSKHIQMPANVPDGTYLLKLHTSKGSLFSKLVIQK